MACEHDPYIDLIILSLDDPAIKISPEKKPSQPPKKDSKLIRPSERTIGRRIFGSHHNPRP